MDETAYAEATRNLPERISSDEEAGMRSHRYYLKTGAKGTVVRNAAALRRREQKRVQSERATKQAADRKKRDGPKSQAEDVETSE